MGTGIGMLGCCRSQGDTRSQTFISITSLCVGSAVSCVQSCNGKELEGSHQSVLTEGLHLRVPCTAFMCTRETPRRMPGAFGLPGALCTAWLITRHPQRKIPSGATAVACKGERSGVSAAVACLLRVVLSISPHIKPPSRAKSDSLEDSESVKLFVVF